MPIDVLTGKGVGDGDGVCYQDWLSRALLHQLEHDIQGDYKGTDPRVPPPLRCHPIVLCISTESTCGWTVILVQIMLSYDEYIVDSQAACLLYELGVNVRDLRNIVKNRLLELPIEFNNLEPGEVRARP